MRSLRRSLELPRSTTKTKTLQTSYSVIQTMIEKGLIVDSSIASRVDDQTNDVIIELFDAERNRYLVKSQYDSANSRFYPPTNLDQLETITLDKFEDWIKDRIVVEYRDRTDLTVGDDRVIEFTGNDNTNYLVRIKPSLEPEPVNLSAYDQLVRDLTTLECPETIKLLSDHVDFTENLLENDGDKYIQIFMMYVPEALRTGGTLDDFLYTTFLLLYQQTETDPPYYVSHAVDHSIRVVGKMLELLDTIPALRKAFENTYPFDPEFIVFITGILHDVGYTDLVYCYGGKSDIFHINDQCKENEGIPSKYKYLHSIAGSNMVTKMYGSMLKNLLGDKPYASVISAIRQHNFDSPKCQSKNEDCIYRTDSKHHSFYLEPDREFKRGYQKADLETSPLLFALRIADNLDFELVRLTPVQQNLQLMLAQRSLYLDPKSLDPVYLKSAIEQLRPTIDIFEYSEKDKFIMEKIISELKKNEFLFNYSNWIVQKVRLEKVDERYLMSVYFRTDVNEPDLQVDLNFYPATYQIVRSAESFSSLSSHGTNLVELIDVNLYYPDGRISTKPLKDYLQ